MSCSRTQHGGDEVVHNQPNSFIQNCNDHKFLNRQVLDLDQPGALDLDQPGAGSALFPIPSAFFGKLFDGKITIFKF